MARDGICAGVLQEKPVGWRGGTGTGDGAWVAPRGDGRDAASLALRGARAPSSPRGDGGDKDSTSLASPPQGANAVIQRP